MDFKTANQCAKEWGISQRRVQILCAEGRVDGAFKIGDFWAIPSETKKPKNKREYINRKTKYNVIDLFCGAGGLSYGFEQAGCNIVLGIDNDEAALKTFVKNHKNAKSLCCDITKINYADTIKSAIGDKKINLIIGGPPCQGYSIAGSRNFDDPRNKLYLSYIKLVEEIKPKAFVIENVPGIISLFNGEVKENIIKKFTKMGYNVTYKILCASDYGVPQSRKRVIFVGILNSKQAFIFPNIDKEIITCKMALSDLPSLINSLGEEQQKYKTKPQNEYQFLMRRNSHDVKNHIAACHSDKIKHIISLVPDGGNYKDLPKEYQNSRNFHIAWTRFNSNKPAPTIDTGHRHHFHYKYNRVPTVRECARLQSFPDNFVFYGNKTQQFRQVGNAVPPLMAKYVAEELLKFLEYGENNGAI